MKALVCLFVIIFSCALLGAISYDEAVSELYATGRIDYLDGDVYWTSNGYLADATIAEKYVAWAAAIILYAQANWAQSQYSKCIGEMKAVDYVSGLWHDYYDDTTYLVYVPMGSILSGFNNDKCHNLDFEDLVERLQNYVSDISSSRTILY